MKKGHKIVSISDRFTSNYVINLDTKCWIWINGKYHDDYGKFAINGIYYRAHRYSYKLYKGEITHGLYVLHKCDNPSCVNPDHLFLGTQKENMQDARNKGRRNSLTHGTIALYQNGCRCNDCLLAGKLYYTKRRKANNIKLTEHGKH